MKISTSDFSQLCFCSILNLSEALKFQYLWSLVGGWPLALVPSPPRASSDNICADLLTGFDLDNKVKGTIVLSYGSRKYGVLLSDFISLVAKLTAVRSKDFTCVNSNIVFTYLFIDFQRIWRESPLRIFISIRTSRASSSYVFRS